MTEFPRFGMPERHWWGAWSFRYGILMVMFIVIILTGCGKDPELQHYEPLSPLPLRVGGSSVVTPTPETIPSPTETPDALLKSTPIESTPVETPFPTVTATPTMEAKSQRAASKPSSATSTPLPALTATPTAKPQKIPAPKPQASDPSGQKEKTTFFEPDDKPEQAEDKPIVTPYGLTIDKLMVCANVKDRAPVDCEKSFSLTDTGKVFIWMKVSDVKTPKIIKHVYFLENKKIATVTLNLKYTAMRTWSQKTFKPDQVGNWKVVVMTEDDEVIAVRTWTTTE